MAETLTLYVEGMHAQDALNELLALDSLVGEVVPAELEPTKTDFLSLTANILQIISAPLLAQQLYEWFQKYQNRSQQERFSCVIIAPDGSRVNLRSATAEEVAQMLKVVARQSAGS